MRRVGGERVAVHQILPAGADAHDYEPRPSDVRALADAELVVRSGGDVDGWLDELVEQAGGDARATTLIDEVTALEHGGELDPHWWQDPRNAQAAARALGSELGEADPAGAAAHRRRAEALARSLGRLDAAIARCVDGVPASRRKVVTAHDSLGYFARRYGIEVVGTVIPALTTQAQASARDVKRLVATIRRERVTTVFPESSVDQGVAAEIARETGARIGPRLYGDSLGREGSPGATLVGSLRFNAAAVLDAIGAGGCPLP